MCLVKKCTIFFTNINGWMVLFQLSLLLCCPKINLLLIGKKLFLIFKCLCLLTLHQLSISLRPFLKLLCLNFVVSQPMFVANSFSRTDWLRHGQLNSCLKCLISSLRRFSLYNVYVAFYETLFAFLLWFCLLNNKLKWRLLKGKERNTAI